MGGRTEKLNRLFFWYTRITHVILGKVSGSTVSTLRATDLVVLKLF